MNQNEGMDVNSGSRGSYSSARSTSPGRQVLTLFGDYWWFPPEQIPSGALVGALGDLGVADGAARAALSRLTRANILVRTRVGRRTTFGLTARGEDIIVAQSDWLDSFGRESADWDGTWSLVAFSVPEARRAARHQVRSRLRWLGFAPLHDGLWISARGNEAMAMAELRELGAAQITAIRTRDLMTEPLQPQDAWDLDAVAAQYDQFISDVLRPGESAGGVAALRDRTNASLEWQRFRIDDPALPEALLPSSWPRSQARSRFIARHAALAAPAEARMREHVSAVDPDLAELVTHRSFRG